MGDKVVIRAKNLSKQYRIFKKNSERFFCVLFGKRGGAARDALKDLNFEIRKGENVAILGNLGAGRTTLLKILSDMVFPTSGKVEIHEKLTPIFDVKAGFGRTLTVRENIKVKASIMGWPKKDLKNYEKAIVEFAEAEEYLDIPLKSCPKAIGARIGFATFMVSTPEILLMDDAFGILANNDFRKKCIARMKEITADENVTLVMSTGNLILAGNMCQRAIVLDKGVIVFDGEIEEAIKFYKKNYRTKPKKTEQEEMEDIAVENQRDDVGSEDDMMSI